MKAPRAFLVIAFASYLLSSLQPDRNEVAAMTILASYLDDVYRTWLASSMNCCLAVKQQAPAHGKEKPMRIELDQPRLIPAPVAEPQESQSTRGREWVARSRSFASRASSRGSFSMRRKLNAYNGPRRPRISAPSDFRHVENSVPRRAERFRPLELSIYMPENHLSPILPHFGAIDDLSFPSDNLAELQYPPTAMTHSRSESALSFRIPRKPVRSYSVTSSEDASQFRPRSDSLGARELMVALENQLPKSPPPLRQRAMTEPPAYERVKSALHEKFELEQRLKDIEIIIEERRSIYMNSRPTSRASRVTSIYEESHEPMPEVNASFAERASLASSDQRPKTAPSKPVHIPTRLKSFTEASATFNAPQLTDRELPPPPLPLVLQSSHPPLRKKKSFSRVSSWLFPASEHTRNISLDSVTNTPKPVTPRDGFYQCIDMKQTARTSIISSVTTVSTMESELDEPTVPTTWTPESSPGGALRKDVASLDSRQQDKSLELTRMGTFGDEMECWTGEITPNRHQRNSVGVAF